jgi:hypothetical protein
MATFGTSMPSACARSMELHTMSCRGGEPVRQPSGRSQAAKGQARSRRRRTDPGPSRLLRTSVIRRRCYGSGVQLFEAEHAGASTLAIGRASGQAWRCPVVYIRERSSPSQRWWWPLAPLRAAAGWTSPAPRATVVPTGRLRSATTDRRPAGTTGSGRAAAARCRRAAWATPASRCGATSTRPAPADRPRR